MTIAYNTWRSVTRRKESHMRLFKTCTKSFMRGKEKEICGLESLELSLLCRANLFVNVILE
jgi:hypothetical protein